VHLGALQVVGRHHAAEAEAHAELRQRRVHLRVPLAAERDGLEHGEDVLLGVHPVLLVVEQPPLLVVRQQVVPEALLQREREDLPFEGRALLHALAEREVVAAAVLPRRRRVLVPLAIVPHNRPARPLEQRAHAGGEDV